MTAALNALIALLPAMLLEINGKPLVVQKRKLPGIGERLDVVPVLVITPAEQQPPRIPFDSRPSMLRTCVVTIGLVAAGNKDPITAQDDYPDVLGAVAGLFAHPRTLMPYLPGYLRGEVQAETYFDRTAYAEGYDYLILTAKLEVVERLH
jgi:hypothetical protein